MQKMTDLARKMGQRMKISNGGDKMNKESAFCTMLISNKMLQGGFLKS